METQTQHKSKIEVWTTKWGILVKFFKTIGIEISLYDDDYNKPCWFLLHLFVTSHSSSIGTEMISQEISLLRLQIGSFTFDVTYSWSK